MKIEENRKAIDSIDAQIIELLNERTRHALDIGAAKVESGEEIYAPHREVGVLDKVCELNNGPIRDAGLRAIFREIMSSSLALQKSMTIAYLGPDATYTHLAAIRRFGSSLEYSPQKSISDVFIEVSRGHADYGVVPIENSTEGVVTNTLDLFVDSDLKIVSQIVTPIQHCLVAKDPSVTPTTLFTHPQALAQCRRWIEQNHPNIEIMETSSTTRAAELAREKVGGMAIASSLAAEKYGLEILDRNIQDNSQNATRFLVLGRQCSPSTGKDRTSLMFSVPDKVGALHDALRAFRQHAINMTKIESRPSKRKAWEYFFFVDCMGHIEDEIVAQAIADLQKICSTVKVLGSYPNTE